MFVCVSCSVVYMSSYFQSKRDTLHMWDDLDSVDFKCVCVCLFVVCVTLASNPALEMLPDPPPY